MEIMGCPFAPLGLMLSVIYNFRGLHPLLYSYDLSGLLTET